MEIWIAPNGNPKYNVSNTNIENKLNIMNFMNQYINYLPISYVTDESFNFGS